MWHMEHLSDLEMLGLFEGRLRDAHMRMHVEHCPSCRSSFADTLVLIRAMQEPSAHGAFDEQEIHVNQSQLSRFYSASHHWQASDHDYFDVAQHLMDCDACLARFIKLSRAMAPDPETMKKVLNTASALAEPVSTKVPTTLSKPIDVAADLIDKLRSKAMHLIESADRLGGGAATSARAFARSIFPVGFSGKADFMALEDAEYSAEEAAFPAQPPSDLLGKPQQDQIKLITDARNERGQWLVQVRISAGNLRRSTGSLFFELFDTEGNALNTGEFPKSGELEVPADMPVTVVKISGKGFSERFDIRFPSARELKLVANVEREIARLDEALRAENDLRLRLENVLERRQVVQEKLSSQLAELERLRREQE